MSDRLQINQANLHFNADGTPVADDFDDVYFSNDDGLAETQYVFIGANRLAQRWKEVGQRRFTVAETGFGSGMNFLACWQAFEDHLIENPHSQCQQLHFISFEKYPIAYEALALCHRQFPSLNHLALQLQAHYPEPVAGCHRLTFKGGKITLDLWLGDVNELLPQNRSNSVDAWFLDGFAPSKNPQMWTENLFQNLFRLAKPGASVATFTAAGLVRRGLADAGFEVKKIPGYGNKRDMTIASKPALEKSFAPSTIEEVAIIGGGIAGCFTAWELAKRGYRIHLICSDNALSEQASGNRQGALYPLLNGSYDTLANFYSHGYRYALQSIKELIEQYGEIAHQWCGVLHISSNPKLAQKHQALAQADYPASLLQPVTATQASAIAGIPLNHEGIFYPEGGWVCPGDLCRAIGNELIAKGHRISLNTEIQELSSKERGWRLTTDKQQIDADAVVIAAGIHSNQFKISTHLPVTPVRGQVSHFAETPESTALKTLICHTGYLTPAHEKLHCLGATFVRNTLDSSLSEQEQQVNLERFEEALPGSKLTAQWRTALLAGRVGFRATVRDHLPLVGPLPDIARVTGTEALCEAPRYKNLFVISGLGARGICSAPIGAAVIASYLAREPQPLSQQLLDAIDPARFVWKQQKKKA